MTEQFVKASELAEVRRKNEALEKRNRELRDEVDELTTGAREAAEVELTARLVSRFSSVQPEEARFADGYDGLAHVALPDGMGQVQVNVSNRVPGEVYLRVWGPKSPGEEDTPGYETDHGPEDFRATFRLTERGVEVSSLDFRKRYR
jgi:hypothetical protein